MGIPVYSGATAFSISSDMKSGLGISSNITCDGYATSTSAASVMNWYKGQMGGWTLMSENSFSPPDHPESAINMQFYKKGDNGAYIVAQCNVSGQTIFGIVAGSWSSVQGCGVGQGGGGPGGNQVENITISAPFDKNDPPNAVIPLGETLEHPKPQCPQGHPGIDFLFFDISGPRLGNILSPADGIVKVVENTEEQWAITIDHGDYRSYFVHIITPGSGLQVEQSIQKGGPVGQGSNVHWEFGYTSSDRLHPQVVCPRAYFDAESRAIIENIPISEKFLSAGYTSVYSGDFAVQ